MSRSRTRRKARTPLPAKCPTPRKLAFKSEQSALTQLRYAEHEGRDHKPERAYECRCGSWHLTSQAAPNPPGTYQATGGAAR